MHAEMKHQEEVICTCTIIVQGVSASIRSFSNIYTHTWYEGRRLVRIPDMYDDAAMGGHGPEARRTSHHHYKLWTRVRPPIFSARTQLLHARCFKQQCSMSVTRLRPSFFQHIVASFHLVTEFGAALCKKCTRIGVCIWRVRLAGRTLLTPIDRPLSVGCRRMLHTPASYSSFLLHTPSYMQLLTVLW